MRTRGVDTIFKDDSFISYTSWQFLYGSTSPFSLQVLSCSVANGFKTLRTLNLISNTEETETFCLNFDKFFDICNIRSIEEGERKRKPNLKPFYVKEDQRLKVKYII